MQAERDHLRQYVFPALEERFKALRGHLDWVEQPRGVATSRLADEQQRELEILKVCLDEVRRCQPFLIVLLGDRYGWVPPPERTAIAVRENMVHGDFSGCSVTDLEIRIGTLTAPDQRIRSFFYFREPLPYAGMTPDVAALYSDAACTDANASERVGRMAALKREILSKYPNRVRRYAAGWDDQRQAIVNLDDWGRKVVEDVWSELTAEWDETSGAVGLEVHSSWLQMERDALDDFIEDRARDFVGRRGVLAKIDNVVSSNSLMSARWGLCILGPSGAGKSAVFSESCRRLQAGDAFVLAHATGASARARSVDTMLRRWIGELSVATGSTADLADSTDFAAVEGTFHGLLAKMAARRRVVIVIDGLDQFEATTRGRFTTWLPRAWPDNARLVVTAIPGEAASELCKRAGIQSSSLPALIASEARSVVEGIFRRYHRAPDPEVLAVLLDTQRSSESASGQPLWLVLAAEELNLIDGDDIARAKQQYSGTPDHQLRALLIDRARALPATTAALYRASFKHAEELFGKPLAQSFLFLLALGRGGWRELDFRPLLPRFSGESWDELRFASLRRVFRGQVAQMGPFQQWNTRHQQMRVAALELLSSQLIDMAQLFHALIADHLLTLPADDQVRWSEAMHHLCASGDVVRAASYFGDEALAPEEVECAADAVVDVVVSATPGSQLDIISSLLDALDPAGDGAEVVARRCLHFVGKRVSRRMPLSLQVSFADIVLAALQRLALARPGSFIRRFDLSTGHLGRAMLLDDAGDRRGARSAYETALEIAQRLCDDFPGELTIRLQLPLVRQKLIRILHDSGELDAALEASSASIIDAQFLTQKDPGNELARRQLGMAYEGQSSTLIAKGDLAGALAAQQLSVDVARSLTARHPGDPQYLKDEAHAHGRLSQIKGQLRDISGAEAACCASIALFERITAMEPDNALYSSNLAVATGMLGRLQFQRQDFVNAEKAFGTAVQVLAGLTQKDPANADWQRSLAIVLSDRGKLEAAQDRPSAAATSFESGLAIVSRLAESDPDNQQWRRDMAGFQHALAGQRQAAGDTQEASAGFARTLELTKAWVDADKGNTVATRDLGLSHDSMAYACLKGGDIEGAFAHAYDALDICEKLVELDSTNVGWRRDLAGVLGTLGHLAEARMDWEDAIKWRSLAAESLARIADAHRDDVRAAIECGTQLMKLGEARMLGGDPETAADTFQRALGFVSARNPGPEFEDKHSRFVSELQLRLGSTLRENDDLRASEDLLRAGLDHARGWAAREPARFDWRVSVAQCLFELGETLEAKGEEQGACVQYEAAVAAWENLVRQDGGAAFRRGLTRAQLTFARALVGFGDLDAAENAAAPARSVLPDLPIRDVEASTTFGAYFDFVRALGAAYLGASRRNEADTLFAEAMPLAQRVLEVHPDSHRCRTDLAVMAWNRAQIAHKNGRQEIALRFRAQARDELRTCVARGVRLSTQLQDMLTRLEAKR